MKNYKHLLKLSRNLNGKLHPITYYYWIRKSPILLPYIVISYLFELVVFCLKSLCRLFFKCIFRLKFKRFIKNNKDKKVSDFIKPIALYLPQYHEIPENNEWWGQGFTEWTNVKKAKPLFEGHYQPHVPHADVGYYDLSDINVMRKQAEMAKKYGVYGFCFYYYHFKDGKRLLEKPINNYLASKDIDFPFCFAWANENWTRVWDGGEKNIIMPQDYEEQNMLNMIKEMLPAFKDDRYIKHNGNPVLLVYRAEIIPQIKEIAKKWKDIIKQSGFDDLYLISMQNFSAKNPQTMGFDAATEFAPHGSAPSIVGMKLFDLESGSYENINLQEYKNVVNVMSEPKKTSYTRFKSVCPSWDNTPRRGNNFPRILVGANKNLFKEFCKNAVKETLVSDAKEAGYIFINAWNEWAEGTHLEPDEKYGYDNLKAIKEIQDKKVKDL